MPYDLSDLHKQLESIKGNPKVSIKYIGTTLMGKQIPLVIIKSSSPDSTEKKALVFLARQHPG
jgi:murein tripeptide amidase MpaA